MKGPHITKIWVSESNNSIVASSTKEAEELRAANPNNPDYENWVQQVKLDLLHNYEDEDDSPKKHLEI